VLVIKWLTLLNQEEEVSEEDVEEVVEATVKAVAEAAEEAVEEAEAIRVTRMSGSLSPSSAVW